MPIINPNTQQVQFLISDLAQELILRTENRTVDLPTRAPIFIRDSLLEISGNLDYRDNFPQLEVFGPMFTLTPEVQEYNEVNLIPPGNINLAMLDGMIFEDPVTNKIRFKMNQMSYQEADKFQPVNSLPTGWYRFNANIGFNPVPDMNYTVQFRSLMQHPINDTNLGQTVILLPRQWNEVIILAAQIRYYGGDLQEFEKASGVRSVLYGDPHDPKNPGVIMSIKTNRKQENWRSEHGLKWLRKGVMAR